MKIISFLLGSLLFFSGAIVGGFWFSSPNKPPQKEVFPFNIIVTKANNEAISFPVREDVIRFLTSGEGTNKSPIAKIDIQINNTPTYPSR